MNYISMSYLQKRFRKNICRVCNKTFCCIKCRGNHEESVHDIYPDCEICIYGKILFSRATQVSGLLDHIKQRHWPIHCLFCSRLFGSLNELTEHSKCPVGPPKMEILYTKTPIRPLPIVVEELNNSIIYNSPPVGIAIDNLVVGMISVTSTPMQGGDAVLFGNFSETITPVDNCEKKTKTKYANENLSVRTPHNEELKKDKRRVTFSVTPPSDLIKRPDNLQALKELHKKCPREYNSINVTESEFVNSENYMSPEHIDNKENSMKDNPAPIKKRRSSGIGDTLWQSAIEEQLQAHCDMDDEVFMSANKKRVTNLSTDSTFDYTNNSSGYFRSRSLEDYSSIEKTGGIWSSMALMVKSVVTGFGKGPCTNVIKANKRQLSDSEIVDMELRKLKRIKLTEIKCRPPIRNSVRKYDVSKRVIEKADKATQTDDLV